MNRNTRRGNVCIKDDCQVRLLYYNKEYDKDKDYNKEYDKDNNLQAAVLW